MRLPARSQKYLEKIFATQTWQAPVETMTKCGKQEQAARMQQAFGLHPTSDPAHHHSCKKCRVRSPVPPSHQNDETRSKYQRKPIEEAKAMDKEWRSFFFCSASSAVCAESMLLVQIAYIRFMAQTRPSTHLSTLG